MHSQESNADIRRFHRIPSTGMLLLQPVPWKMRLGMIVEMQIEILNGGEILVN